MESEVFHLCAVMKDSFEETTAPVFVPTDAIDRRTGEHIRAILLHILSAYQHQAIQVYFCPWCGEQLTPHTGARSMKFGKELDEYGRYRKRWVKQGTPEAPLSFGEWQQTANEYDETNFLLNYAQPQHTEGLMRRKQVLRNRLALGVVLARGSDGENEGAN